MALSSGSSSCSSEEEKGFVAIDAPAADVGRETATVDTGGTSETTPLDTAADGEPIDTTPFDAGAPCETPCALGLSCVDGACVCKGTICDGACVDIRTDPRNCGECGKKVCAGEICAEGKPTCAPLLEPCAAPVGCLGCKETQDDPVNCGFCGRQCGETEVESCRLRVCVRGISCTPPRVRCPSPTKPLGGGCFDLNSDLFHCGTCDNACGAGQYCANGKCVDYRSAPGCSTCPCKVCADAAPTCCLYAFRPTCTASPSCPP
jgi:hypothetical protein